MKLAEIFCDNMVLQRDCEICIFGTGIGDGLIEFCGQVTKFTSEEECFRVYLPSQSAGGPYEMKVTLNGESYVLKNILIGDVYIAAGQSNMEFPVRGTAELEMKQCNSIRFFKEPHHIDDHGNVSRVFKGWEMCDTDNIPDFSAIGYYFSSEVYEHTRVPVGIIECNRGCARADAWTSPEIVNDEEYQSLMPVKHSDYYNCPCNKNSWLYQNKLLPIAPYSVSGVLWYQGESNRGPEEATNYHILLDKMIENWRDLWTDKLPFYCVQLMPFDESEATANWAAVREAQEYVSMHTENVYMITLEATGESRLIHPTRKRGIATALANAVFSVQYGEEVEYCGPVISKTERTENGAVLSFCHANGLIIQGKYLEDTYAFDKNGTPYTVDAQVVQNKIVLKWKDGVDIVRISMGYCNNPKHNLYNAEGYLASPFNRNI